MKRKAQLIREELNALEFVQRAIKKADVVELEGADHILKNISENIRIELSNMIEHHRHLRELYRIAQQEIDQLKM